jgi:phage terminase small subunit
MFCEAVDRREEFGRALVGHTCPQCGHLDEHQTSLMLETSTGYAYINPAAVGVKQMEEQIAKWMSVLGMTPSARGALGVAEVKAASTLDKLAARKRALVETGGLRASTPSSRRRQSEPETETTS